MQKPIEARVVVVGAVLEISRQLPALANFAAFSLRALLLKDLTTKCAKQDGG